VPSRGVIEIGERRLQMYLAQKKAPTLLGPPSDPVHSPAIGSKGGAVSYERGTPVEQTMDAVGSCRVRIHPPSISFFEP